MDRLQQEALAALTQHGGYRMLIECLKAKEQLLLDNLRGILTDEQALPRLRQWQVFSTVIRVLEVAPHEAAVTLQLNQEEDSQVAVDPYEDPIFKFSNRFPVSDEV